MEIAGTILAVPASLDLCLKYGKRLVSKYRAFRSADNDLRELIVRVEDYWIKFEYQINFLRDIWNSLDERLQIHHNHRLQVLKSKLQQSNDLLDSGIGASSETPTLNTLIGKAGSTNRVKYSLGLRESLRKAVDDLEMWHKMFDPSCYLLSLVTSQDVDDRLGRQSRTQMQSVSTLKMLREAIQAGKTGHSTADKVPIWVAPDVVSGRRALVSNTTCAVVTVGHTMMVVDTISPIYEAGYDQITKDIRDLARILSKSDPHVFGLLRCVGAIKPPPRSDPFDSFIPYELVFSVPAGLLAPTSLRTLLQMDVDRFSLNQRLHLAQALSSSVMYIHSSQIVHKSIRPENIIVFGNSESVLAAPFLVGFEKFRPVDGLTRMRGDPMWERNIYRHPSRQGTQPEERYTMQHDIYSLGVVLLEIGLWGSFVVKDSDDEFVPGTILKSIGELDHQNCRQWCAVAKQELIALAKGQLVSKLGQRYSDVVISCLTCLDKSNNHFGDQEDLLDQDGIVVGVRYIEKVLLQIHEISI